MSNPQESWTILTLLRWTTDYFREKGVSEPRASAEVLLAHVLNASRLNLYLRFDQPLNAEELARFKALVIRRRDGEPTAYLTGHREFWSLDFLVTPAVLIPRPETETLVAAAMELRDGEKDIGGGGQVQEAALSPPTPGLRGVEIGVGSGAVIVALAKELPQFNWVGLDISGAALAVARENARRHGVLDRLRLLRGDLLSPLKPRAALALLVANLPYVPRREWEALPREIRDFEPKAALCGGEDGLEVIRRLMAAAPAYLQAGGWLLLEVGDRQAAAVAMLLTATGAYDRLETIKDFSGIDRVIRARRCRD
jgi:release factor glutamine methyltransferase